jgi:hypothetical protein
LRSRATKGEDRDLFSAACVARGLTPIFTNFHL